MKAPAGEYLSKEINVISSDTHSSHQPQSQASISDIENYAFQYLTSYSILSTSSVSFLIPQTSNSIFSSRCGLRRLMVFVLGSGIYLTKQDALSCIWLRLLFGPGPRMAYHPIAELPSSLLEFIFMWLTRC